jgi:hypothetical protein
VDAVSVERPFVSTRPPGQVRLARTGGCCRSFGLPPTAGIAKLDPNQVLTSAAASKARAPQAVPHPTHGQLRR